MKVWASRICALVLALAMTPGAFELMENAAHLAAEGHLAHAAADGDRHDPAGKEHGCTPLFHACGCHASLACVGNPVPAVTDPVMASFADRPAADPPLTGFRPAVDRPPQV